MTVWKEIVCLANSRKHGGTCVAGIDLRGTRKRSWVRPVSARDGHAVSLEERRFADGGDLEPLDIIRVPLLSAKPWIHQTENWLLDPRQRWVKVGEWPPGDVGLLEDHPADLWGTGDSSGKGRNDRIAETAAARLAGSLAFVRVDDLRIRVYDGGFGQVKREVRAIFDYQGVIHNLKVTDPAYERHYLRKRDGIYNLEDGRLTVSLAEPFDGFCYKLVAAIIEPGGPLGGTQ